MHSLPFASSLVAQSNTVSQSTAIRNLTSNKRVILWSLARAENLESLVYAPDSAIEEGQARRRTLSLDESVAPPIVCCSSFFPSQR